MTARRALLSRLVDYAGLFPPADLALDAALQTYAAARAGGDAWMLSRFIVPAATLGALAEQADGEMALSVLGLARSDGEPWLDGALRTVAAARQTEAAHPALTADRFELRASAADVPDLERALGALAERLRPGDAVAVEVPYQAAPETVGPAAAFVADANGRAGRPAFALKLRCGGVTADAFPPPDTLAAALDAARRADVPFKATAGLHHPLRHDRPLANGETARMHGFVNVFGGAALARLHGLDADALAELLADGDASSFDLADGLRWRSLSATGAEVADARRRALSYGSCSFDEPTDDLRDLGWLSA